MTLPIFSLAKILSQSGAEVTRISKDNRMIYAYVGSTFFCIYVKEDKISFMTLAPEISSYKSARDLGDLKQQIGLA